VSFRFALDPTAAQARQLLMFAGARRMCFNHHIGRVNANLAARSVQRAAQVPSDQMTPALSWSRQSFINELNAWKTGRAPASPVSEDGTRGLVWRDAVSADVFECASVDAAQALANYKASAAGARSGVRVGFPAFKARHHTTPAFRLRSKAKPGASTSIRFCDSKHVRLPKLGELRISGCARTPLRMVGGGRFHVLSATLRLEKGRW
jgi:putative transposase